MVKLILSYFSGVIIVLTVFSQVTNAANLNHLVINEVQTNGPGTGTSGEEFIEIHNPTNVSTNISNWSIRYISSTGSLMTAKSVVTFPEGTVLYPQGYIIALPQNYLPDIDNAFRYSLSSFSGLSYDGASLDLVNAGGDLVDRVGWGDKPTTILSETLRAVSPPKGESIQRKLDDSIVVDTDNNLLDFEINTDPTPITTNVAPPPLPTTDEPTVVPPPDISTPPVEVVPPTDTPPPTNENNTNSEPSPTQVALSPLQITELMIDPASPLSDSFDEWVEIYNPNSSPVNLEGYSLLAGLTGSYKYIFQKQVIEPNSYITVSSKDTPITLSNSGSKVILKNDKDLTIDEVNYDKAETGNTYAKDALGNWLWTTTPTPSAINIITYPVSAVSVVNLTAKKSSSTKKSSVAKPATVKKVASKKEPASKVVKKAKSTAVKGTSSSFDTKPLIPAPSPVPGFVLAILGVLAILYCCYEYKFEISNKFRQLRLYRESRSKNR